LTGTSDAIEGTCQSVASQKQVNPKAAHEPEMFLLLGSGLTDTGFGPSAFVVGGAGGDEAGKAEFKGHLCPQKSRVMWKSRSEKQG